MKSELQIGIVGSYGGSPLDILLPIINENELKESNNKTGHCFHIFSLSYTELYLFSKAADGTKRTAKLDIRSSCKPDSDISLIVVKMNDGSLCLRSYIDSSYQGLYVLPETLTH